MPTIEATVVPNTRGFSASYDPSTRRIKVRLTERAEKGKANAELVEGLAGLLSSPVAIIRGHTSKRKLLQVGIDEDEIARRLGR